MKKYSKFSISAILAGVALILTGIVDATAPRSATPAPVASTAAKPATPAPAANASKPAAQQGQASTQSHKGTPITLFGRVIGTR